jgi:hypothetical protein
MQAADRTQISHYLAAHAFHFRGGSFPFNPKGFAVSMFFE